MADPCLDRIFMVKRLLRYLTLILLSGALLLILLLFWLLESQSGARWLLTQGSVLLLPSVRVERVEGTLAAGLTLSGVHCAWQGGTLGVDSIRLRWNPAELFNSHLLINELTVTGVTIDLAPASDAAPEAAPGKPWQWPVVSGWPLRVAATIEHLQLERVTLNSAGAPLLSLTSGHTRLSWREGVIEFSELTLTEPRLALQGKSRIGLSAPFLSLDLSGTAPAWAETIKDWSVVVDLRGTEQALDGTFRIALTTTIAPPLTMQGKIALGSRQLRLANVQLEQHPAAAQVTGDAVLALDQSKPLLQLAMEFRDINLQQPLGVPTRLSGRLDLQGEAQDYRGSFAVANADSGWRQAELQGEFQGNRHELVLSGLNGSLLQGRIDGRARIDWSGPPRLEAWLQGRSLDAGELAPFPMRNLDLDLDASWQAATSGPGSTRLSGRLRRGDLAGYALTGELDATYLDHDLLLSRLELQGSGIKLRGSGRLSERLNFTLTVAHPDPQAPDGSGDLTANAWLSRQGGRWAGAVVFSGQRLRFSAFSADVLTVELGLERDERLSLQLAATNIEMGGVRLTALTAQGEGTLARHRLQLDSTWDEGKAGLTVTGGLTGKTWRGSLERLAGADRHGPWQLEAPVTLDVERERLTFNSLRLRGQDEELQLNGSIALSGSTLTLEGDWRNLRLARLNALRPELALQGRSSGRLVVALREGRLINLRGNAEVEDGNVVLNQQQFGFAGSFTCAGDDAGQNAAVKLSLAAGGEFSGGYSSAAPLREGFATRGEATATWDGLNLALFPLGQDAVSLTGSSSGELRAAWQAGTPLRLQGGITADGTLSRGKQSLRFEAVEVTLQLLDNRLQTRGEATLAEGGRLHFDLQAEHLTGLELPPAATLQASWSDVPVQPFLSALTTGGTLTGSLSGELAGRWSADQHFELTGRSALLDGTLAWQDGPRLVSTPLREVELEVAWREEALTGRARLALGEHGRLDAELQLPLPARLPLQLEQQGALAGKLSGKFGELGILGILLPGVIKESRGAVEIDLSLAGTPLAPLPHGYMRLSGVGGYLPTTGLLLQEGSCVARIEGDTLRIETLSVKSGEGRLVGEGALTFSGRKLASYEGKVKGEKVQLLNLPELQISGNPDLAFSGTAEELRLTGELLLSPVRLRGSKGPAPKKQSADVVLLTTQTKATTQERPIALSAEVRIVLGKQVLIDMAGVSARIEGDVLVRATGWQTKDITGTGKLETKEGTFSIYGARLDIEKGNLLFAGGAINAPTLDVLALRKIDDIKAGVRLGGTLSAPKIVLYSEPSMQDTEILSYIVFGRPLSAEGSQLSMLSMAATSLLTQNGGSGLQDKLKEIGVDTIDVTNTGESTESSVVTVGKYLTPDLYFSLGRSIFSATNQLQIRYDLDKKWQVESTMGTESAVDLYYKIEFD